MDSNDAITPVRRGEAAPESDDFLWKEVYSIGAGESRRTARPTTTLFFDAFASTLTTSSTPRPRLHCLDCFGLGLLSDFDQIVECFRDPHARCMLCARARMKNLVPSTGTFTIIHILCIFGLRSINDCLRSLRSDATRQLR